MNLRDATCTGCGRVEASLPESRLCDRCERQAVVDERDALRAQLAERDVTVAAAGAQRELLMEMIAVRDATIGAMALEKCRTAIGRWDGYPDNDDSPEAERVYDELMDAFVGAYKPLQSAAGKRHAEHVTALEAVAVAARALCNGHPAQVFDDAARLDAALRALDALEAKT